MEEPACGVKAAVEEGAVSRIRYDNYRLFYEELRLREKRFPGASRQEAGKGRGRRYG